VDILIRVLKHYLTPMARVSDVTSPAAADIKAIDVHAHYGRYQNSARPLNNQLMSADADHVVARAKRAHIGVSIVSPLQAIMPRGGGAPIEANETTREIVNATDGLLQWVVIDPRKPGTLAQAGQMLQEPRCVGIKIHPEEHIYRIGEHGDAIFEFAAKHDAVILSHSGEQNSLPADLVRFANNYPSVRLILAHIGCGWDGDLTHQVRAIQSSRHGNVFADTSSAASLTPGLIEWAVAEVGAERILFGTDSPLYSAAMQRARIDDAEIGESDKRLILRDNAVKLLKLG
jgi:predicted TIM-barrel fold metal-dependent hydrolase